MKEGVDTGRGTKTGWGEAPPKTGECTGRPSREEPVVLQVFIENMDSACSFKEELQSGNTLEGLNTRTLRTFDAI